MATDAPRIIRLQAIVVMAWKRSSVRSRSGPPVKFCKRVRETIVDYAVAEHEHALSALHLFAHLNSLSTTSPSIADLAGAIAFTSRPDIDTTFDDSITRLRGQSLFPRVGAWFYSAYLLVCLRGAKVVVG